MTTTVSEFKGQVTLSSDAGTITTIGNSTGTVTLTGTVNATGLVGYATTGAVALKSNIASPSFTGTVGLPITNIVGTASINTTGDANTTIGTSGGSGTITINRPLTSGVYGGISLSASQIGYNVKDTITLSACASGAFQPVFTDKTLPAGVWLINYSIRYLPSASTTIGDVFTLSRINGSDNPNPPLSISGISAGLVLTTSGVCFGGTFIVPSNGSTTYTVNSLINFTGVTVSIQGDTTTYGSSVWRTRIA